MTPNRKRNIKLHIEELVLDGFSSRDKNQLASVVRQELQHLLSRGDIPRRLVRSGDIPQLDGGTIQMEPKSTVESKGIKIARNLHGGLQK